MNTGTRFKLKYNWTICTNYKTFYPLVRMLREKERLFLRDIPVVAVGD